MRSKTVMLLAFLTLSGALFSSCQQNQTVQGLTASPRPTKTEDAQATSASGKVPAALTPKQVGEISFMAFNVENLFDTEQDSDREDYTYLPLSLKQNKAHRDHCKTMNVPKYREECLTLDWNDEYLEAKMKNLSQVVLDLDGGIGPDVLLLEEVENIKVLTQWNQHHLQKAGYKTVVLLEGFDERGIDTALLSRFPIQGKPIIHRIPFDLKKIGETDERKTGTRGILEVTLKTPKNKAVTVFVVHLPSQGNPTGMRKQATEFLLSLMQKKSNFVVAGGDFNIIKTEEEENGYFKNFMNNGFEVSHFYGCPGCEGTHNYKKSWSFLDALVFSKNMDRYGIKIEPQQIDVIRYNPQHLYRGKYPRYFDMKDSTGASDHFPIYMRATEK